MNGTLKSMNTPASMPFDKKLEGLPPWSQLQTPFHNTAVMKSVVFDGSPASESKDVVVCLELLTFQISRFYASLEQPQSSSSFPLL